MIDSRTAPYAALLLRVGLGVMFIAHSLLKILVITLPVTAQYFQSMGLPGWFAYLLSFAELGGGALLILGLHARWVALALTPILVGATVLVHWSNGWLFANEGGGWEYTVFLIVASLALALLGDGAYALRLPLARTKQALHAEE